MPDHPQVHSLRDAVEQVTTLIHDEHATSYPEAKPVTVHLETWNTEASELGVRVAEIDYRVIDPAPALAAGASIMQSDTDGGLQICAATERLLVSIMRGFPAAEVEQDQHVLLYLLRP